MSWTGDHGGRTERKKKEIVRYLDRQDARKDDMEIETWDRPEDKDMRQPKKITVVTDQPIPDVVVQAQEKKHQQANKKTFGPRPKPQNPYLA